MAEAGRTSEAARKCDRLHAALSCVNAWISDRLTSFFPFAESDGERLSFRMKAFGELGLYLHVAERLGVASQIPVEMTAFVRSVVLSPMFLHALTKSPARTSTLAMCLLPDALHAHFDGIALYYKELCRPLANEMRPYKILSHVYILDALGLYDHEVAEIENRALRLSALFNIPNSLAMPNEGPYPFTHSAFYATRFGRRPLALTPEEAELIAGYIDIELCRSFCALNLDVALELALAEACLCDRTSEKALVVVESAISLLEEKDHLQSPRGPRVLFTEAPDSEWEASYHTMVVMGLLLMRLIASGAKLEEGRALDGLALAMDAVGTMYAAVDSGNFALVVYLYSKLSELDESVRPSPAALGPIVSYVESLSHLVGPWMRDDPGMAPDLHILGMRAGEFRAVMEIYRKARAAVTSALEPLSPESRAHI